jgi:NAD(P)-dependent dehydrogenase (short-subunit alcohol dehydrogenase family)
MNSKNLFDLSGRVAIVTGGAGLLGPEHAMALADYGAIVYLADISEQNCTRVIADIQSKGYQNVYQASIDVTDKDSWDMLLKRVLSEHKRIDILINNAAYTNQSKSTAFETGFENYPVEEWNAMMNVNLTSVFLGCQVIGSEMVARGKGSIINVASLYGVVSPNHNLYPETGIFQPVAYSVSKHGVIAFTKYLSTLWASKGVRVNTLTPGGVFNNHTDPFLERFSRLNPSGRMSRKDELRGAIVYLASDASSYTIGHNLIVDGGWTVI